MTLSEYDADMRRLLDLAGELLGERAMPVSINWELEQALLRRLRRVARHGLSTGPPVLRIGDGKPGHEVDAGLQLYTWELEDGPLLLVRVIVPCCLEIYEFWAVAEKECRRFYRHVRRLRIDTCDCTPPVMAVEDRDRLWNNSIGYLRGDDELFVRYGVPKKRGVLLSGQPGNGKTMACRWLKSESQRIGLAWRGVTVEEYEHAKAEGDVQKLFQLDRPGIVLFDDFDTPLRRRETTHDAREQSTFLAELDGMHSKSGIVFLFTSNLRPAEVDVALRRPGRIDVILEFPRPTAALRLELIRERWHADIQNGLANEGVALEDMADETDGLSFAELEEVKKLLVLRRLESGRWDWPFVSETLRLRSKAAQARRPIGFTAPCAVHAAPAAAAIVMRSESEGADAQ